MVQSIPAVDVTHRGRVLGEIMDEPARYLTVRETADRLRVTPHTVYRWCRTGRLQAMKIGKEWRIPAQQLEGDPDLAGLLPLDTLLSGLSTESEHLLALATDQLAMLHLEATFFDVAATKGARLLHIRWHETEVAVRQRLQAAASSPQGRTRALHLLDFKKAYEKQGVEGTARLLLREIHRARADGMLCWAYGSPYPYFAHNYGRLIEFERGMHERLRGQAAVVLSAHVLSDLFALSGSRALSLLMELADTHSGVICFDGQRALLERPAGRTK